MRSMPPARASGERRFAVLRWGVLVCAVALAGCASGITTPLPDLPKSQVSTALSPQDRKKAVDDLTHARDTSEQDAAREIEGSR